MSKKTPPGAFNRKEPILFFKSAEWLLSSFVSFLSGSLTQSPVAAQLLVDLLHPLDVEPARLRVVHHGFRVMDADYALGGRLHGVRGVPRVVDVLGGETSEDR